MCRHGLVGVVISLALVACAGAASPAASGAPPPTSSAPDAPPPPATVRPSPGAAAREAPLRTSWFESRDCSALVVNRSRSVADRTVLRSVRIEDAKVIARLVDRIEAIPPEGDTRRSLAGGAAHLELVFHCGPDARRIDVVDGRFVRPSRGDHSGGSELEAELHADIDALLSPSLARRLMKVRGLELALPMLSLTYEGRRELDGGPSTATGGTDVFVVKGRTGAEQRIEIFSGQKPPAPATVRVDGRALTILTYETREKERLFPHYVQIVE